MPPTTTPPPGALFVIGIIILVAACFILMLVYKGAVLLGARRAAMSSGEWEAEIETDEEPAFSPATTSPQYSNNGIATPTTDSNALLLRAKAETLAALVKAGKVGETEGIKLIFGVAPSSSNPRYIEARAALKEALARLDPPKFNITPEQQQNREALGLNQPS